MVLITIVGLSIGYCSLDSELRVSGEATVRSMYAKPKILFDNGGKEYIESKNIPDFSKIAATDEGMFATLDNDGTSYYFRGAVENNWLYFAGYYWRIIRINGDGSIRVIYNGTTTNQTGDDTQIGVSVFNEKYDQSEYVGFKYTLGEQHGININSTIMNALNDWYTSNMLNYSNYVNNDTGFCNDREMASGYEWSSQPSATINYKVYERISRGLPSLKCSNNNDIFKIPIGLITADEVMFAGIPYIESTTQNYLYTGHTYWVMSPSRFEEGYARVFYVYSGGILGAYSYVNTAVYGLRPVINLKASILLSGNGTLDNPYKIVN